MLRVAVVVSVVACSSPATRDPVIVGNAPPAGQRPLRIELPAAAEEPPWFQPPIPEPQTRDGSPLLANGSTLALGARSALISIWRSDNRSDIYVADVDGLLAGPVALPASADFVGIGGDNDQVFVVDGDQLKRADSVATIATSGFKAVAKVPAGRAWAVAPGIVAYADLDTVYTTQDGTGTWAKSVPVKGARIQNLFARADGVLVAQLVTGKPLLTYISKDRKKWKESRLQPLRPLWQSGGWIRTEFAACTQAVLSADGEHWVQRPEPQGPSLAGWLAESSANRIGHGPATVVTATTPPAPAFDGTQELVGDVKNTCRGSTAGGVSARIVPSIPREVGPLSAIRGTYQSNELASTITLEVIEDGVCRAEDLDDRKFCKPGATWLRPPHLALYNYAEDTAQVLTAPPGCNPRAARSAVGLGILLCDGTDSTHVYVTTVEGEWYDEGTLPGAGDVGEHEFASDGTIVVRPRCADHAECIAWVRSPLPAGDPKAWRVVRGGHVYRAAGSGAVVAVKATPDASGTLAIAIAVDRPNQPVDSIISGVVLPSEPTALRYTDAGIELTFEDGTRQRVFDDGSLRP